MKSLKSISDKQERNDPVAFEPLVRPLPDHWTPDFCFARLCNHPGCVWLDSSLQMPGVGRYSYLAADPVTTLRVDSPHTGALNFARETVRRFYQPRVAGLPPMQGGWMGWMGYELGGCFERLPEPRLNDFALPLAELGLYDVVLAWDHETGKGWLISQGIPEEDRQRRARRAYRRMRAFEQWLSEDPADHSTAVPVRKLIKPPPETQHPSRHVHWSSNFTPAGYREAVSRCIEYILSGDVFQVNLSQRLLRPAFCRAARLYMHLRKTTPAPFSGYADFGRVQVLSTSPERFLHLLDGHIETRPIKGTRPRMSDPVADSAIARLLEESEKDRAENIMIVDLLRNDLSRVAEPSSVDVPELCRLEKYPFVWHLVSVITARLAPGRDAFDLIEAAFPGGSITGAPKIRAIEILAELERVARGPYCGAMGYISLAGDMDTNILIRTLTACDGWWSLSVGGGIVADSDPVAEEQETWHKAAGLLRSIESLSQSSP